MAELKIGDKAPELHGTDENGKALSLKDFSGKKLILFFYPKDDTPGCTAAACSLRDNFDTLRKRGFEMLGVSPDTGAKHNKFIEKHSFPFSLLVDTEEKATMLAYGVWAEKSMFGNKYMGVVRTTYVIDENGNIEKLFKKVKTKTHADQILESYDE